ncbi:MAG: CDP-alcohol phosphatidyltransferase family protein [Magnetospirillum sp.]|nr:CDP-alcohol phosphatidyltransferase family protein [Magnetospirillum sp.]
MPETRRLAARWIGWSPIRIWGMVPVDRLRRSLARAGLWDAGPWTGHAPVESGMVLLVLGDHVYNDAVVHALVHTPALVLVRGDGRAVAAHVPSDRAEQLAQTLAAGDEPPPDLPRRRGRDLVPPAQLRGARRPGPLVMPVSAETRRTVENRLFDTASRATTDVVNRVVWPLPARALARIAANAGISPNLVTLVGLLLAVLATLLFAAGGLAAGLAVAWAMSLLDAVDGRLARVTLSFSQVGSGLERLLHLLHPPLWWWAWWVGCGGGDWAALVAMVGGSPLLRAQEILFRWRFGFPLPEWSRFDGLFRLVAGRRNVLLVFLTVGLMAGQPLAGFQAAALWLLVSLAVHAVRLAQAWRTRPVSWLCE